MTDVAERLKNLSNLFKERDKVYKSNYKNIGCVLRSIFPDGAYLRTEEEFNRFFLFMMLVFKLTRASKTFPYKLHGDSLDDLAVYAQMIRDYDDSTNSGQ